MSEVEEVIATVLPPEVVTDKEEHEFVITLRGSDVQALAKHISSIEVEHDEAIATLASMVSKIAQIFVKRNDDFSVANFIVQCGFNEDSKSAAIVTANALSLKASLCREVVPADIEALTRLTLAALSSPPILDDEDASLEFGALPGAPTLKVGDKAFVIKPGSRHLNQGPFEVVEVNLRTNVVILFINNTRQDYKSFNLRKA